MQKCGQRRAGRGIQAIQGHPRHCCRAHPRPGQGVDRLHRAAAAEGGHAAEYQVVHASPSPVGGPHGVGVQRRVTLAGERGIKWSCHVGQPLAPGRPGIKGRRASCRQAPPTAASRAPAVTASWAFGAAAQVAAQSHADLDRRAGTGSRRHCGSQLAAVAIRRRPPAGPGPSHTRGRHVPRSMACCSAPRHRKSGSSACRDRRSASSRWKPGCSDAAQRHATGAADAPRDARTAPPQWLPRRQGPRAGSGQRRAWSARAGAHGLPRDPADRRGPRRQVQPVRLAHHRILGDAHAPANLGRGVALVPQGPQAKDRFVVPVHSGPPCALRTKEG